MDVADVHFDDRHCGRDDGVENCQRGMGEGAGIDDDAGRLSACLLQPVDDVAFVVGLPERDRKAMALGGRVAEVSGNRLLAVILTALRDPIVRLITTGLSGEHEVQARAKVLRIHGKILKAIRAQDGIAADRLSRRHLFDIYALLVGPDDRPRLESLLS